MISELGYTKVWTSAFWDLEKYAWAKPKWVEVLKSGKSSVSEKCVVTGTCLSIKPRWFYNITRLIQL